MKVAILLKSGPHTDDAGRALEIAADMLAQGHTVSIFLLQDAVRFCQLDGKSPNSMRLHDLIAKNLEVHVLMRDAELRGLKAPAAAGEYLEGSYESVVDLMESCDRVVGIH
jgi:sulfur relay (sulfurtransferase) complex TusBCD TusD component (DsrE family)